MRDRILIFGVAILIIFVTLSLFFYPILQRVRAQNDLITDLNHRLIRAGVPVKSIEIKDQSNLLPEITIQRIKNKGEWSSEDLWNEHMTRREAIMSYKSGYRLNGFTLIVLAPDGEQISWSQTHLDPDDLSQQPYMYTSSIVDDKATQNAFVEHLKNFNLTIDEVKVKTGIGSSENVQLVEIRLSTDEIEAANKVVRPLIESIRQLANRLNQEDASRISIIRVRIEDSSKRPLLEYLWDIEVHMERGGTTNGLYSWFTPPFGPGEGTVTPSTTTPSIPLISATQPYSKPTGTEPSIQDLYPPIPTSTSPYP